MGYTNEAQNLIYKILTYMGGLALGIASKIAELSASKKTIVENGDISLGSCTFMLIGCMVLSSKKWRK